MKKLILTTFLLLFLFQFFGCNDDDPTPLEQLPPATQTGENTFGCLVNGEAYVIDVSFTQDIHAQYTGGGLLVSAGHSNSDALRRISMFLGDNITVNEEMFLDSSGLPTVSYYETPCSREREHLIEGKVTITRFDLDARIVSGFFEFSTYNPECGDTIRVTDGRFDISNLIL